MRVLYIASNPEDEGDLRLEKEITELQNKTFHTSSQRVEFIFLPSIAYEDIETYIYQYRPDIVHISAHGEPEKLILANSNEGTIPLSADALKTIFSGSGNPRLVYISACQSVHLARELSTVIPMTIGTTADITNLSARQAAVNFYRGLLQGKSVQDSFNSSKATIEVLSSKQVSAELFSRGIIDAKTQHFFTPTKLVAQFEGDDFEPDGDRFYFVELGLIGCYPSTNQVTFITDDETFIDDDENIESDLCSIVRTTPVHGEIWLEEAWSIYGDFKVYACATTVDGRHISVSSTICEMLESFYMLTQRVNDPSDLDRAILDALADLRRNDGSRIKSRLTEKKKMYTSRKTKKAKKSTKQEEGLNGKEVRSEKIARSRPVKR